MHAESIYYIYMLISEDTPRQSALSLPNKLPPKVRRDEQRKCMQK